MSIVIVYECDGCKKREEGKERPKSWRDFRVVVDDNTLYLSLLVCSPECGTKMLSEASPIIFKTKPAQYESAD